MSFLLEAMIFGLMTPIEIETGNRCARRPMSLQHYRLETRRGAFLRC